MSSAVTGMSPSGHMMDTLRCRKDTLMGYSYRVGHKGHVRYVGQEAMNAMLSSDCSAPHTQSIHIWVYIPTAVHFQQAKASFTSEKILSIPQNETTAPNFVCYIIISILYSFFLKRKNSATQKLFYKHKIQ